MTKQNTDQINGACHCGAVRFTVQLSDGLNSARRCTCSFCRMRGAVAVSAKLSDINVWQGEDALTTYQFNTNEAKHHFCSVCGIYTHHQRRSRPDEYGVNVACLEDHSPFDFADVIVYDGVNHPSDAQSSGPPAAGMVAGHLAFIPANSNGRPGIK